MRSVSFATKQSDGVEATKDTSSTSFGNLRIGDPDDAYEQEADHVAAEVMAGGAFRHQWSFSNVGIGAPLQRKCSCSSSGGSSGECEECKKKEGQQTLQREPTGTMATPEFAPPVVHDVLNSSGQPLEPRTRSLMESRFGRDFRDVRLHASPEAAMSAQAVNSLAYTVGQNIVFGQGRYVPDSTEGQALIAHELSHTLQQRGTPGPALQRQTATTAGARCDLEICFMSIRKFGLGTAGFKHAVVNVTDGSGQRHIEVDPDFHQPAGMLHSHVVNESGLRAGGDCQKLPATCAESSSVVAAANDYESRDVIYDPLTQTGPNSNSFAEWIMQKGGLNTTQVNVPFGASGWNYFVSNPTERTDPPHVIRSAPTPAGSSAKSATGAACTTVSKPAKTSSDFVSLVRVAETKMTAAGISGNPEKIKILRGLYYGTPFSVDFLDQKSASRIAGFQTFTGTGIKYPRDPVSLFDCGLYQALQLSEDINAKGAKVDVGHLLIALDARNAQLGPVPTPNLPFPGFGGSGVEIVTWLGDLGGGAASLALDRASSPGSLPSVAKKFSGTDYGAASNLEGDVAGFLVARGSAAGTGGADVASIPASKGIADALEDYFGTSAAASSTGWNQRAKTFLGIYGGVFDAAGNLTNTAKLIDDFADKIESFACEYLVQRKADSSAKISDQKFLDAADNVRPCSREMAETFVNTLIAVIKSPGGTLQATGTTFAKPRTASPGACSISKAALRAKMAAKRLLSPFSSGDQ